MNITFGLLGLSICAVWLPGIQIGKKVRISPWILLFTSALIAGLAEGFLTLSAIIWLGVFGIVGYLASRTETSRLRQIILGTLTGILALILAIHRIPGFNNPVLLANVQLSPDAAPFTQYANFDKASVGLILLAFFCNRASTISEWSKTLRRTYPVALVTGTGVIVTSIVLGYIRPDFKLSSFTAIFLATNLLFTCVAEEAFFRGFLQDRLAKSLHCFRFGNLIAILCSGILFGVAHVAGGPYYMMLAALAGFGYAYAYTATQRIEAPILTHFALNAVHFIGFTYPHLQ